MHLLQNKAGKTYQTLFEQKYVWPDLMTIVYLSVWTCGLTLFIIKLAHCIDYWKLSTNTPTLGAIWGDGDFLQIR